MPMPTSQFQRDLQDLINKHSMESFSDTPDFILAEFLSACLEVYDRTVARRENWHGRHVTSERGAPVITPPQPLGGIPDEHWVRSYIWRKTTDILVAQLCVPIESITLDARLIEDLDADSLDAIELIIALEHEFELQIPDDIEDFKSVRQITTYLEKHLSRFEKKALSAFRQERAFGDQAIIAPLGA